MRRMLVAGVVLGWMAVSAPPAAAGGWWSHMDIGSEFVAVGEDFVIRNEAFFTTFEEAQAAKQTPYYIYLVRGGYDRALQRRAMTQAEPKRWWAANPDADLIQIGRVRFTLERSNVGRARARVRIPNVQSGRYHLMMCDAGCVRPFAHAVPSRIRVTADPVAVRAMRRTEKLEQRLAQQGATARSRIRTAEAAAQRATTRSDNVRAALNELTERVQALEAEQAAAVAPPRSQRWPLTGAALLAAIAAIAAIAWGVHRRAARPRRALGQPG